MTPRLETRGSLGDDDVALAVESLIRRLESNGWPAWMRRACIPRETNPGRSNPAPRKSPGPEIPRQGNPPLGNPASEI